MQNDIPGAIAYMTEAVNDVVLIDSRKVIPEYQSELSNLYRLSGNLPKAEELASEAATSAQSFGIIPQIPRFLNVLAEIQIDQHKYVEADHTYDRAAAIQDVMIGNADSVLGKTALIKGASDLYAKHFALIAEHTGDVAKAFAILEQARGRVMTDLLMSGAKASPEAVAAEHKIAELRLQAHVCAFGSRHCAASRRHLLGRAIKIDYSRDQHIESKRAPDSHTCATPE